MDPDKNEEKDSLKQIRTFQGDVAEALQKQEESLVSIQRREHLRKESSQSTAGTSPEYSKKSQFFLLLLGSFLLFVLGIGGAWYAYSEFVRRAATPIASAPASRFVSTNTETIVDLATTTSREILVKSLFETTLGVPAGELKHIVLRKVGDSSPLLSTNEFLGMLESQAPGSLMRAFDPLFMFGVFGESNFLIIKLVSFENAFAGMLAWEKNLNQDIGPLFKTAELLRNIPPESAFIDIADRNKDIRALALEAEPLLLYSFLDNNTLIITDRLETLRALIDRLTREKLSR